MVERGRGTILFSGCSASLNGIAGYSELCNLLLLISFFSPLIYGSNFAFFFFWLKKWTGCGKFAMRGLSECLAREFQPLGIHVAHVIIHGIVGAPRYYSPLVIYSLLTSFVLTQSLCFYFIFFYPTRCTNICCICLCNNDNSVSKWFWILFFCWTAYLVAIEYTHKWIHQVVQRK